VGSFEARVIPSARKFEELSLTKDQKVLEAPPRLDVGLRTPAELQRPEVKSIDAKSIDARPIESKPETKAPLRSETPLFDATPARKRNSVG
jgi:hypothetical protein